MSVPVNIGRKLSVAQEGRKGIEWKISCHEPTGFPTANRRKEEGRVRTKTLDDILILYRLTQRHFVGKKKNLRSCSLIGQGKVAETFWRVREKFV